MKYVAEIESPSGETATKEYEALSIREVVKRVNSELWHYPGFRLLHVKPVRVLPEPYCQSEPEDW